MPPKNILQTTSVKVVFLVPKKFRILFCGGRAGGAVASENPMGENLPPVHPGRPSCFDPSTILSHLCHKGHILNHGQHSNRE